MNLKKKLLAAAICALALASLASCQTLFGTYQSPQPQSPPEETKRCICRNTYSVFPSEKISKDDKVVVWFCVDDLGFEGRMEEGIASVLKSEGVDAIPLAQKAYLVPLPKTNPSGEPLDLFEMVAGRAFQTAIELDAQHVMAIFPGDIYTYTHGEGIATIELQSVLYQLGNTTPVLVTTTTVTSSENNLESYAETIPLVCEAAAAEIAGEYLKACGTTTENTARKKEATE